MYRRKASTIMLILTFCFLVTNSFSQEHGSVIISENLNFDCVAYFAERDTIIEMGMYFEEPPMIIGGVDTIQHLLEYPEGMELYKISGNAYASILIDTSSEILCYKIFTGLSQPYIDEVIAVLNKLEFQTASIRGKPLRSDLVLPFYFRYDVNSKEDIGKKRKRKRRK